MQSLSALHAWNRSFATRGLVVVLLTVAAISTAGCNAATPKQHRAPASQRPSLGELVFRILRQNLQASGDCPAEYVAALDTHHEDFVTSFDYAIAQDIQNDVPDLLGGTIMPQVDNGKLPHLVDKIAQALALLISDSFDKNRTTIHSLANLANARTLLESTMAFDMVRAVLTDTTITDKLHALTLLAQENDGVDYVMDDLMSIAASGLQPSAPSMCTGIALRNVQDTLLRTTGFVDDPAYHLGAPAWMVRPDKNGNPRVLVDASTGKLATPFVDANNDGAADVNANGEPIDATGAVIDIPFLGTSGSRDAQGRALNAHGGLLYDYYDAKRTATSFALQLGADLLAADVHRDLPPIAAAVLGNPATCNDGTTTCRYYPGTNHPIADIFFLIAEIAKYDRMLDLVDVVQVLLSNNPTKSEQLLVALGDVVKALQSSTLSLTDTALIDTGIGLMPLIGKVFTVSNTTGQSTPRLLVDLLYNLGAAKYTIPTELDALVVHKGITGTVDYSQPRCSGNNAANCNLGAGDNRSDLERLIELFDYADCGYIGPDSSWAGVNLKNIAYNLITALVPGVQPGTVSQVLVDALSHMTPSTVSIIIDLINGLNNIPLLGSGTIKLALEGFGCSSAAAQQTSNHLPALTALAQSGGLDWILPLAKVFADQGQLRTLVDIFGFVAEDLRLDEDASASTVSVFRRIEPPLHSMIAVGAVDKVLQTLDILYTMPTGTPNETAVDLIIDTLSRVVTTGTVTTRQGAVSNTSLGIETLKVLKTLVTRLNTASAGPKLTHMLNFVTGYLTRTTGTGSARKLANPNLRLLLAVVLQAAHDAASLSTAQYTCYMNELETRGVSMLTGRNFATVVRVLAQLTRSPNAAPLEDWLVSFLRGNPTHPDQEVYGSLLQIAASVLSSDVAGTDMSNVVHWLEGVSSQNTTDARDLLVTVDDLLQADTSGAILQIVRNMVNPGPLASMEAPISTFASTFGDVAEIDSTNMCMASSQVITAARLESTVTSVVDFLNDPQNGIGAIWRLVGTIAPDEPTTTAAP